MVMTITPRTMMMMMMMRVVVRAAMAVMAVMMVMEGMEVMGAMVARVVLMTMVVTSRSSWLGKPLSPSRHGTESTTTSAMGSARAGTILVLDRFRTWGLVCCW